MPKEQDLIVEILKDSPLLTAFLSSESVNREIKINLCLAEKMKELLSSKREVHFVSTLISSTNILAALEMVDPAAIANPWHEANLSTALIVCMGYEIGQVSKESKSLRLFTGEITNKAILHGTLKPTFFDIPQEYPITKNIVASLLASGALMAKPNDPGLQPFEEFLRRLG